MQEDTPLLRAIAAARAGRELTARDMFLEIVRDEPRNEVARMIITTRLHINQRSMRVFDSSFE